MSSSAKPAALPQQIELFDSWFAGADEADNSRTLAFWDLLPWHLVSRKRSHDVPEPLTFEGVKIADGCEANVTLTPAILRDSGSKTAKVLFPGVREELVLCP